MTRVLEDLFRGHLASPSFSQELRFRWEDIRRHVRVCFGGIAVSESTRVMLVHEFGWLPVFSFPKEDVRMDLMQEAARRSSSPLNGGIELDGAGGRPRGHTRVLELCESPPRRASDQGLPGLLVAPDGRLVRGGRAGLRA